MKLQPISKRDDRTKGISLTIGVDGRMYISSGLRSLLKHTKKESYYLYFDDESLRIGISKKCDDQNIEPFQFNVRGEGRVVSFIEDCEIQTEGKPITFIYEGVEKSENPVYTFFRPGRKGMKFIQEKNGNLEHIR